MMNSKLSLTGLALAFASLSAVADDTPWSVSAGLNYREAKVSLPANRHDSESWTVNTSLMKRVGDGTFVGGGISYQNANVDYKPNAGHSDTDSQSFSVFAMQYLNAYVRADGSLGYGRTDIDNHSAGVTYDANSRFLSASLGLTFFIPIHADLLASVVTRYTHIDGHRDSFTNSANAFTDDYNRRLNYLTLGGRLDWQMGQWRPFARLEYHHANREFLESAGDKDYFSYGAGASYALSPQTSLGFSLGSIFNKAYAKEVSAGINLNHRF